MSYAMPDISNSRSSGSSKLPAAPLPHPEPSSTGAVKSEPYRGPTGLWSAAASIGLHLAVACGIFLGWSSVQPVPPPRPAMSIELAPLPSAPPAPPEQVAPGPKQTEAQEPQEEVEKLKLPPVPVVNVPNPAVVVPKETQKQPDPRPTPPRPPAPQTSAPQSVPLPTRDTSGAPTQGTPNASDRVAEQTWEGLVLAKVEKSKRTYNGSPGVAVVRAVVDRSGRLASHSLAKSSGDGRLDEEALATVSRANPFPAPPASMQNSDLVLLIRVLLNPSAVRRRR